MGVKDLQDKKQGGWFEKQRKKLMHTRHENSWVGRRRSNTPPTKKKLAGLTKRRMTDIPSLSVELYLKGNQGNGCPAQGAKDDIIFETLQHKIQDRRRSTPAVLRQCPMLSESLERLALGMYLQVSQCSHIMCGYMNKLGLSWGSPRLRQLAWSKALKKA